MKEELRKTLEEIKTNPSSGVSHDAKITIVQVEEIFAIDELTTEVRALRENLGEYNKTSDRFTRILILVAILQLGVALVQVASSLFRLITPWVALGIEVVLLIGFLFAFRSLERSLGLKEEDK